MQSSRQSTPERTRSGWQKKYKDINDHSKSITAEFGTHLYQGPSIRRTRGERKNISLSQPNPMAIDDWRHQSDMTKVFLRQLINL